MKAILVTPVSHLSTNKRYFDSVLRYGYLEGRDEFSAGDHCDFVKVFHSEYQIHVEWTSQDRLQLVSKLNLYSNLEAVSFHMATRFRRYGVYDGVAAGIGEPMTAEAMLNAADMNIRWFRSVFTNIKVLVENNNDLGGEAYSLVTDPVFISEVVAANKIHFLFDYAHALISSYNQRVGFWKYFSQLPVDNILQVHLSEPGFVNGIAKDAHEIPCDSQIEFCLNQLNPNVKYYTIEYYKSLRILENCLSRIEEFLR